MWLSSSVSLLVFYLPLLSPTEKRILKSRAIIVVYLFILSVLSTCFLYFEVLLCIYI